MVQFNEDGRLNGMYAGDDMHFDSFSLEGDKLTIYAIAKRCDERASPLTSPGMAKAVNKSLYELATHNTTGWSSLEGEMFDVYAILSAAGIRADIDDFRVGELCRCENRNAWTVVLFLKPARRTPWADWPKQPHT